jgi:hypothetical protein
VVGLEVAFIKVTAEAGTRPARTDAQESSGPPTSRAAYAAAWSSFFCEDEMNVYTSIGYAVGTPEALALAARLSAWHDAMVAHQRPADTARVARCNDDCPHGDARRLWLEAVEIFGEHTKQFGFLRRHGMSVTRDRASGVVPNVTFEPAIQRTQTASTEGMARQPR